MRKLPFLLVLFILATSGIRPAESHPHTWIDLETAPIINKDGMMTGLWVGWLFDDFYSAFTLDEMPTDKDGNYNQILLNALAKTNLKNLSEYSYFTFVKVDSKVAAHKPVTQFKTFVEQNRLWMEFVVELETPVDIKAHKIDYAVYDPTYYVEILHAANGDPIHFQGEGSRGCAYSLNKPEPPEDMSLYAAALDQDETGGDDLGEYFAERIEVSCP